MKTPVSKTVLRQHFTYNWWKYLLIAVLGSLVISLLFTVTKPRTPENLKVDFYVCGYANQDKLSAYMEKVRQEEMSDMQEMNLSVLMMDDTYGTMQLVTYMAVREGDLYLLDRENFMSVSANGGLLPLENDQELLSIFTEAGLDLKRGWRTENETGEKHLVGIPMDLLPGLSQYAYAENGYLTILYGCGNDENALKFLRILCRDMLTAPEESEASEESEKP